MMNQTKKDKTFYNLSILYLKMNKLKKNKM